MCRALGKKRWTEKGAMRATSAQVSSKSLASQRVAVHWMNLCAKVKAPAHPQFSFGLHLLP